MDPKARKSEFRQEVIARILAMDDEDRRRQEQALVSRFEDLPGFAESHVVLLYAPGFPEEVNTRPMLQRSLELGKRLVLPIVDRRSRSLRLAEIADLDKDLQSGHRGIPEPGPDCTPMEPNLVDWVLVPGLAFDAQARRLGRGAGHYDKLLPSLRPECPRWALILDRQWFEDLPTESHDQTLDGVADAWRTILGPSRSDINH